MELLRLAVHAGNIGFAARLARRWSNGHLIAVVLHLGWTFNLGLLFVNLYFYIFNQQRFRAGRAMNSSPAASPARYTQLMQLKSLYSFSLIVSLVLNGTKTLSQDILPPPQMLEIESVAKLKTDSLLNSGIDTVIGFYALTYPMVPNFNDTIPGYVAGIVLDDYYILYSQNETWTIIRFATFSGHSSDKNTIIQSKPIILKNDSSLIILRKKLPEIENEGFLPFVMVIEKNGTKGYEQGGESHSEQYSITVTSKHTSIQKSFEEYILYEKYRYWDKSPINVNYSYNKSLSLYYVYTELKSLANELDKKFVFK